MGLKMSGHRRGSRPATRQPGPEAPPARLCRVALRPLLPEDTDCPLLGVGGGGQGRGSEDGDNAGNRPARARPGLLRPRSRGRRAGSGPRRTRRRPPTHTPPHLQAQCQVEPQLGVAGGEVDRAQQRRARAREVVLVVEGARRVEQGLGFWGVGGFGVGGRVGSKQGRGKQRGGAAGAARRCPPQAPGSRPDAKAAPRTVALRRWCAADARSYSASACSYPCLASATLAWGGGWEGGGGGMGTGVGLMGLLGGLGRRRVVQRVPLDARSPLALQHRHKHPPNTHTPPHLVYVHVRQLHAAVTLPGPHPTPPHPTPPHPT
jgi:hypothetical protein